MKSQKHNLGEVQQLSVNIDKKVVDTIQAMSQTTGIKVDELVVIALKRYISSHCDFLNLSPSLTIGGHEFKK